ncbi:hypothetical protein K3495_g5925 [Podosphaera aphanis]|nr:hypothetical protein K3495_g5925 [Podosphaera aphanis]
MFGSSGPTSQLNDYDATLASEPIDSTRNSEDSSRGEKKRRSSAFSGKASSLLASAKNTLLFNQNIATRSVAEPISPNPLQKLGMQDPALSVPQGQHNNSAGESHPGPRSTFAVGVWEDRNKKCRRTMEDTHAFLYNFLHTPAPAILSEAEAEAESDLDGEATLRKSTSSIGPVPSSAEILETDNGYFAIFDGHAGTFAADWCGKKLHIILEDLIRRYPNEPIPELLDRTFTSVDAQLEKLPLKNSGCTAAIAVLRWEDRIPHSHSGTGSTAIAPATVAACNVIGAATSANEQHTNDDISGSKMSPARSERRSVTSEETHARLKSSSLRQRILYTANVGDARIVLCRKGKALRLTYDHKGSDENEGKRIAGAGGLILNNRVNGVLAVTRALGDNYIKDLVTGHPYTTETVIQPSIDEFLILACDGLWDVCSDQDAVNLIREVNDPTVAARKLVDHALAHFSTDNLSCMIVRFNQSALMTTIKEPNSAIGVQGDPNSSTEKISEVEKIVGNAKRKVVEGAPSIGVSGSNFGMGRDSKFAHSDVPNSSGTEAALGEGSGKAERDQDGQISPTTTRPS